MERIRMAEGFTSIITELERQKTAIDKALAALRDIEGIEATAFESPVAEPASSEPATRKGGMSPEGRKRLIAALKRRWAPKKAAASAPVVSAPAASPHNSASRKVRLTEEGRKRLAEAMKRRWAVKRAASAVKKVGRRKAA
jgi:hypothetical protein